MFLICILALRTHLIFDLITHHPMSTLCSTTDQKTIEIMVIVLKIIHVDMHCSNTSYMWTKGAINTRALIVASLVIL